MSEEINTYIPRVTPTTNLLTKYIAQTAYDLSYLEGRENLQAIKSVAVAATIYPPDYSEEILDSLELSDDSISELSEEEILQLIEKRKERMKEEEMLINERKDAREALLQELQVKSTGTEKNPALTVIAPESKPSPALDKSTIVAKAYTPPPKVTFESEDSGVSFTKVSESNSFSDSTNEIKGAFSSNSNSSPKFDTNA